MRVVLQRVTRASAHSDGELLGEIGAGAVVLAGIGHDDTPEIVDRMADKVVGLRYFEDAGGRTNLAIGDTGGSLLVVSQFTLAADVSGGNRPSFTQAAAPDEGRRLYDYFVDRARAAHPVVATGEFGADMQVHLVNDGPVTIPLQMA